MEVYAKFANNSDIFVFVDPRVVRETVKKMYDMGAVKVSVNKNPKL